MTTLRLMLVRKARRLNWKLVALKQMGMAGVLAPLREMRNDTMRHARNAPRLV